MPRTRSPRSKSTRSSNSLMVRLDEESKSLVSQAAAIRRISVSDYVRTVMVGQARRDVQLERERVMSLTPEEQQAFWAALNAAPKLTRAQRRLGALMRGEE